MLGKTKGKRRKGWQRWLHSIPNSMDMNLSKLHCRSGEGNGTPLQYSCLENPMDGEAWWAVVHRVAKSRTRLSFRFHTTELNFHFHFSLLCFGEGNGNPLQCSCLENPRDGRAWWATVYRVAQSRTRLKWLSSSNSSTAGDSEGQGSLACCSPQGLKTQDTNKRLNNRLPPMDGSMEGAFVAATVLTLINASYTLSMVRWSPSSTANFRCARIWKE